MRVPGVKPFLKNNVFPVQFFRAGTPSGHRFPGPWPARGAARTDCVPEAAGFLRGRENAGAAQQKIAFAAGLIIFWGIMKIPLHKLLCAGLACGAVLASCRGGELNIGVYQPHGVNGAVLPELLKPWAIAAGIRVTPLRPDDLRLGKFKNVDVFVVADADSHTAVLNPDAVERKAITDFVHAGGGYVGICSGCTLALDGTTGLGLVPLKPANIYGLKKEPVPVKLQMTRLTQTVLGDDRKMVDAIFEGGPVLEPSKKAAKQSRRFNHVGLYWEAPEASTSRRNPLAFTPAIVTTEFGSGRVICFCMHPERTPGLEGWLPSALRWAAGKTR
jgi:hypothetical protein